jgi:membrane protease YdiL (CAAX protease family)
MSETVVAGGVDELSGATGAVYSAGGAIAPWWHTVLVLLPLAVSSVASAHLHRFASVAVPGLSLRLATYAQILVMEWFCVALIWWALRRKGMGLGSLVGGRWDSAIAALKDVGLGIGFLATIILLLQVLSHVLGATNNSAAAAILPKTATELAVWLVIAATAGFCEELIFRGYLVRQFSAWSGSIQLALVVQAVLFGLGHGYYGKTILIIMLQGWLMGALAVWRKSLRPGMVAHVLQDALGGVMGYLR